MVGESGGAMDAPHPFLLEDRELRLPVGEHLGDAGVLVLQRDELGLPLDPRALELGRLGLLGGDVLLDVDDRRLERPRVLVEVLDAGALGHHLLELLVEEVDLVLLLLDLGVAPPALRLVLGDQGVLLLDLLVHLLHLHLELRVVRGDVQGVDADARELVLHLRAHRLLLDHELPRLLGLALGVQRALLCRQPVAHELVRLELGRVRLAAHALPLLLELAHLFDDDVARARRLHQLGLGLLERAGEHHQSLLRTRGGGESGELRGVRSGRG